MPSPLAGISPCSSSKSQRITTLSAKFRNPVSRSSSMFWNVRNVDIGTEPRQTTCAASYSPSNSRTSSLTGITNPIRQCSKLERCRTEARESLSKLALRHFLVRDCTTQRAFPFRVSDSMRNSRRRSKSPFECQTVL